MKRRILSMILSICMVITVLPVQAFAALLNNDPAENRDPCPASRDLRQRG